MAKHLTDVDVEKIVGLLDGWNGKLTWDLLCKACGPIIGTEPTRQTLSSFQRIKDAYSWVKKGDGSTLKTVEKAVRKPSSLAVATDRIARLEAENARLKRENNALLEQFLTWQHNSQLHGISRDQLDQPLPKIDREKTE